MLEKGGENMAARKNRDYFGLNVVVSAILAFFFGCILGIVVRFVENKPVAGIVRLIITITGVGALLLNIIDFVLIIVNGSILRVINS